MFIAWCADRGVSPEHPHVLLDYVQHARLSDPTLDTFKVLGSISAGLRERDIADVLARPGLRPRQRAQAVLLRCDSTSRTRHLVELCARLSDRDARAILREHYTTCDATYEHRHDLQALFRRVGYVSDTRRSLPDGELTIYRAEFTHSDPREGLAWTLDLPYAERYAEYLAGGRAEYLGMHGSPTIRRATIDAQHVLGYFVGRGEAEIVPDWRHICVATAIGL